MSEPNWRAIADQLASVLFKVDHDAAPGCRPIHAAFMAYKQAAGRWPPCEAEGCDEPQAVGVEDKDGFITWTCVDHAVGEITDVVLP
jgi:hypothetical protein